MNPPRGESVATCQTCWKSYVTTLRPGDVMRHVCHGGREVDLRTYPRPRPNQVTKRCVYPPASGSMMAPGQVLVRCEPCRGVTYPTTFTDEEALAGIYLVACGGRGGVHIFQTTKPNVERYIREDLAREAARHRKRCRNRHLKRGCKAGGYHHEPIPTAARFVGNERIA